MFRIFSEDLSLLTILPGFKPTFKRFLMKVENLVPCIVYSATCLYLIGLRKGNDPVKVPRPPLKSWRSVGWKWKRPSRGPNSKIPSLSLWNEKALASNKITILDPCYWAPLGKGPTRSLGRYFYSFLLHQVRQWWRLKVKVGAGKSRHCALCNHVFMFQGQIYVKVCICIVLCLTVILALFQHNRRLLINNNRSNA